MAKIALKVTATAGIHDDSLEMLASQALRYEAVSVKEHTRPIKANPYPDKTPMVAMSMTAGMTALGASPNMAIPAGNDNTPAPTIDLTKLKIKLGIVAVSSFFVLAVVLLPVAVDVVVVVVVEARFPPSMDE
jgi:hypothetical protein